RPGFCSSTGISSFWLFAVFGGITNLGFQLGAGLFFNPKGIGSFSPALARCREGLRWLAMRMPHTLKGEWRLHKTEPP
ncbi:MAG: hypothetical protein ABSC18_16640, partial [Verrucomicrobiota bacterium]